jgi:RNA polymerase sigma-70 factor (ECF subfamily)
MTEQTSPETMRQRARDAYLVVAAQTGDRAAFALLVRRWHGRLLAHALRLTRRRDVAEDAVQAAWVEIVRGLPALRDERAFPAWAFRIVTRRLMKSFGRGALEIGLDAAEVEADVGDVAVAGETAILDRTDLGRAMTALSPVQRAAIALHYFEGLSVAEVAVALEVPAGTIKTRLMHARAHLRAHLKGVDHA